MTSRGERIGPARRLLILASLVVGFPMVAVPGPVIAHPSVSVVVTQRGVYFSDLSSVLVLRPDGRFEVAVAGVHAHALYLAADGSVCGEDVANEGDVYRFRTFCLRPDGRLVHDGWMQGHPAEVGISFSEPATPSGFWALDVAGTVRRIDRDGRPILEVPLGDDPVASWVTATSDGALVVRGSAVYEVRPDRPPAAVGIDLVVRAPGFAWVPDRHALGKPFLDSAGRAIVPVFAGGMLLRLGRGDADPEVIYRSAEGWSPTGGTMDENGTLWVLEWSSGNRVRLVRRDPDGGTRVFELPQA